MNSFVLNTNLNNQEAEQLIFYLERMTYELLARENIIEFMTIHDWKDTDKYNKIWEEYLQYLKAYDILKEEFRIKYIAPYLQEDNFNQKWKLNFITKEVIVYE